MIVDGFETYLGKAGQRGIPKPSLCARNVVDIDVDADDAQALPLHQIVIRQQSAGRADADVQQRGALGDAPQHFRVPPGGESEDQGIVNETANHANPAAGSWESRGNHASSSRMQPSFRADSSLAGRERQDRITSPEQAPQPTPAAAPEGPQGADQGKRSRTGANGRPFSHAAAGDALGPLRRVRGHHELQHQARARGATNGLASVASDSVLV